MKIRERMKKLSVVGRVNSITEGGETRFSAGSESISKRFKVPRKFFYDSKTVDHASVPRKLRSAMKKRNRESMSPPLLDKTPNHGMNGIKIPRKDGKKNSRLNQQGDYSEGSPSRPVVGPFTKDEEEVVETLYALAEMFPSNNEKNGSDGEFTKAKSWPLPEGESSKHAFEDSAAPEKEEDSKSLCPSNTEAEAANYPTMLEGSAQDTVELKCFNELSQPGFPRSVQLHTKLNDAISQSNVQVTSLLSKSEPMDGKPSCSSIGCNVQSELSLRTDSKQPRHEEPAACVKKPEIEAAVVSGHHELQYNLESKQSGSALWLPGLSSAGSHSVGTQRPIFQSSSENIPSWLGASSSATPPGSWLNGASTKTDSKGLLPKTKSWKRCSAHVYISRLIKVLQIAKKTDSLPTQPTQLTSKGVSKQGVLLTTGNLYGVRNGLNGGIVGSAAEKYPNEVRNGILLHKRLLQDHQQASTTSAVYSSQKQSFDFLSLSAGGGGIEAPNSSTKDEIGLEPSPRFHIPYPQSLAHTHTILPFSLPENHFPSTPFTYHLPLAAAKQIQPPPCLGSPLLSPPNLGKVASPKQQQLQQQQQWIWTAQQKPVVAHITNWQNGRQGDSSYAIPIQYAQSIPQPSYSSQQQQQQQLLAFTSSLPAAKSKRQQRHHHLPYEGNGVGSYPDTALPLQFLCNEHV